MCNTVRSFRDTCNFLTEMFAALSGSSVRFSSYLPKGSHKSRSEAVCPSGVFFVFEEVRKGVKKQGKKGRIVGREASSTRKEIEKGRAEKKAEYRNAHALA